MEINPMHTNLTESEESLSPEQVALLAEKGLKAVPLSRQQKKHLIEHQMDEVYAALEFEQANIPWLDSETIETLVDPYSHSQPSPSLVDIWVKLGTQIIETIHKAETWQLGSPAFAVRANSTDTVSFHKKLGKMTIHLEIVRRDESLADINVKLIDNTGNNSYSFDVELIKENRCVETINTTHNNLVSFLAVAIDDYILRVSDAKKEIASLSLRMEQ
jgi:hypothetical protein